MVGAKAHYWRDLAERVAFTFLAAFLAALLSGGLDIGKLTDVSVLGKAALAGLAAVATLIKGLVAARVGQRSASLDPQVRS